LSPSGARGTVTGRCPDCGLTHAPVIGESVLSRAHSSSAIDSRRRHPTTRRRSAMHGHRTCTTSPAARTTTPAAARRGPHLTLRPLQFRICFPRTRQGARHPHQTNCGREMSVPAGSGSLSPEIRLSPARRGRRPMRQVARSRFRASVRSDMIDVIPTASAAARRCRMSGRIRRLRDSRGRLRNFQIARRLCLVAWSISTSPAHRQGRLQK
jgi:hypothetical protein